MAKGVDYLDALLRKSIVVDGAATTLRPALELKAGAGVTLTPSDDKTNLRTVVTVAAAGGLPAGTLQYQVATWNGAAWTAGQVNLGSANAVTGTLPVVRGGTGLAALGAANEVLRVKADGTALEYGKLTTTNIDAAAAITGSQLAAAAGITAAQLADGGANKVLQGTGAGNTWTATPTVTSLTATSYVAVGASPAGSGAVRLPNAGWLTWNSDPAGTDIQAITVNASENLLLGTSGANGVANILYDVKTGGVHQWRVNNGVVGQLDGNGGLAITALLLGPDPADTGAIRLSHATGMYGESNTPGTDRAIVTWGVVANDTAAFGDANVATQVNGSTVEINGASATLIEAVEIAAGRRVVSLALGADLTTTEMPANTGDRVVYIANCATAPTGTPVSGGILYSSGGNLYWRDTSGVSTQLN